MGASAHADQLTSNEILVEAADQQIGEPRFDRLAVQVPHAEGQHPLAEGPVSGAAQLLAVHQERDLGSLGADRDGKRPHMRFVFDFRNI